MSRRLLLPIVFLAVACGSDDAAPPAAEPATPVRVAEAVPARDIGAVTATGTLGAKDEVTLSFKIGGIVARTLVDDGATVRRGQLLAQLDQREIDALVAKAAAGAEKARRDAARAERLFKDSVVTLVQYQDAQSGRDAAEADLRQARVNLEYATIVAPSDGVVLTRTATAGQLVGPGTPVIQFAARTRGSVLRVGVADRDAVRVRVGDAATVRFDALPEKTFRGRVSQVAASADPRSGTYTVEVTLDGVATLPSGLVGRVTIAARCAAACVAGAASDVAAIPADALIEGDGTRGAVFTLDASGTRVRRVAVELVGLRGDQVLVRGLAAGARVVSAGATALTDSAKVEVAK
ncbi:MAG: efflux RND transporter periplasmic adaptor subunit [Gemmatimonadaceae bacterium]|nr:efflux RND transporter periplasmic adaptor subunit [Gemmatimonadaceae bacterium]